MKKTLAGAMMVSMLSACSHQAPSNQHVRLKQLPQQAPVAQTVEFNASYHGQNYSDPYHWLKDQDYPEVDDKPILDYLKAENAYFDGFKSQHQPLIDELFSEFKGRVNESETSVPWQKDGYEYRWEFKPGADYRTWYMRKLDGGQEQILLDEPELAKGHKYFVLGDWSLSKDKRYLAYTVDTTGDERYQLVVKDLQSGDTTKDKIEGVGGSLYFAPDSRTLFYGELDKERWKLRHIKAHTIGDDIAKDKTLVTENDDGFFLGFGISSSEQYLIVSSSQREISEVSVLDLSQLDAQPQLLVSREQGFSADVDHAKGKFFILANDTHVNSRLAQVQEDNPEYNNWQTMIAGSDQVYLRNFQTFEDFIAIKQSTSGAEQIRIHDYKGNDEYIKFPEDVFTARLANNPEFNQKHIRLDYQSMITPATVYDYDLATKKLVTKKVKTIPSGYDKSKYHTERLMATARDGAKVPVSIVYPKGFKKDGSQPVHLTGYGAYGAGYSPRFSTIRLSLLDRGFAVAIAHIRGGDEMGYQWYLDGKLKKRQNTFNDFVDVAQHLVKTGFAAKGNISISGRSAGGELMGASVIQAPDMWRSVILGVPFVDVLNTMLDASLPLTPPEWVEWGNPIESKEDFDTILAYSPYDNIQAREYPPMLVTGGLYDPRVTYWEPAKWTARMRASKTDDNLLMMRMNMGAGHFANSGRYGRLKDFAEEYAFILTSHQISQ